MSLLELRKKKKKRQSKTKKCNGNGQVEKGIERFISSLVLGGLSSGCCNGYFRAVEGGKKEIKNSLL